jgi:hypothetical protein
VAASDYLLGIGGIYPNHTAGFGGGAKLALGVLATRSIARLHYRHEQMGWGAVEGENPFRRDLEAVARLVGLNTTLSLQIDARGEIVRLACGDHLRYFPEEVKFARETFAAPAPEEADVLVANAFPNDLSLTFARVKGTAVFARGRAGASRVVVAALTEGAGHHGLFPAVLHSDRPRAGDGGDGSGRDRCPRRQGGLAEDPRTPARKREAAPRGARPRAAHLDVLHRCRNARVARRPPREGDHVLGGDPGRRQPGTGRAA